ncbi:MAG: hypothetical protein CL843_09380 [Crocinitomicaceae bacterium]|nr:hypothetical protein [Crocinitomicaceae bacterium]|tara:strand:+ start:3357 stop:3545 length:189 start_codon:yes stop_codon:yes gene_type:complete
MMDKESQFVELMRTSNRIAVAKNHCKINPVFSDKIKPFKNRTYNRLTQMQESIGVQVNELYW